MKASTITTLAVLGTLKILIITAKLAPAAAAAAVGKGATDLVTSAGVSAAMSKVPMEIRTPAHVASSVHTQTQSDKRNRKAPEEIYGNCGLFAHEPESLLNKCVKREKPDKIKFSHSVSMNLHSAND